jgi:hypothetical protein
MVKCCLGTHIADNCLVKTCARIAPDQSKASPQPGGRRSRYRALLFAALLMGLSCGGNCRAQLCVTTHVTDLYCLIPAAFHTEAAPFNALFTPFGTELSELPTAKPGGMVLTFSHGLLVPASESLGAVFTERAEALGRHRFFVGVTYQDFLFNSVDGLDLKHIPIVLYYAPLQVYTVTDDRFAIRAGQFTALAAYGVTSRIDVSVAIPFERISMGVSVNGNEYGPGGATAPVSEYVPGTSSGLADVVFGAKAHLTEWKSIRLAAGVDVRIPSGDELNFLGSGTTGVKPYLAVSRHGRISPHGNVGYQWNGNSILNANSSGGKQQLPTNFFYTAGANFEATKKLTLIGDLLGQYFYSAPRLAPPTPVAIPDFGNAPSVEPHTSGYAATNLGLGFKAQTYKHLILTGNLTIKLNNGGLRATVVPLAGLSYSF